MHTSRYQHRAATEAMNITHAWAKRAIEHRQQLGEEFKGNLFGIVQGNFYEDLRKQSAEFFNEMDFPGIAIGGLSVGESREQFSHYLGYTAELVTKDKLGTSWVLEARYILEAVENGIDMFDCVLATRMARNGGIFLPMMVLSRLRKQSINSIMVRLKKDVPAGLVHSTAVRTCTILSRQERCLEVCWQQNTT